MQIVLPNVAHVPLLGYNLLSLKRMADRGHKHVGEKKRVALHLKHGKTLFGPSVGKLYYFSGFRRPLDSSNPALARGSTIGEGGDTTILSPGRSTKQPLPGMRLHDPLHGRQACPEFIAFDQGVGQICPR